jgi:hypothetical protein
MHMMCWSAMHAAVMLSAVQGDWLQVEWHNKEHIICIKSNQINQISCCATLNAQTHAAVKGHVARGEHCNVAIDSAGATNQPTENIRHLP